MFQRKSRFWTIDQLILTDATVWTGKARGTLATVPVITVHTGPTVVAVTKTKQNKRRSRG